MSDRRQSYLTIPQIPLRHMVLAIFLATWLARLLFLVLPEPLSLDERFALTASQFSTAAKFMNSGDWRERWEMLERLRTSQGWVQSTPRIFWTLTHLIWGYLFPSNGQTAYALTQIAALIAMLALAGAARNLYGERGFLLCLLIVSLSPLFLNYTVRVLGTMPATMWICLALFFLTAPGWTTWNWIAGGLCLGLAFATHYGSGVAVVAIGFGLGLSVLGLLLRESVPFKAKLSQGVLYPAIGALAAAAPLAALEAWSQHAGTSHARIIFSHGNLAFEEVGPYGLWIRELFELDPLLEVAALVAMAYTFQSWSLSRFEKTFLGIAYILIFSLVIVSLGDAPLRSPLSLTSFALFAAVACATRALERDFLAKDSLQGNIPEASTIETPFTCRSLTLSIVIAALAFTAWRQVSSMPRGVFPAWPLFVLGVLGLIFHLLPRYYHATVRGTALLGSLLFVIGAGATYHAKSAPYRAQAYAAQHPQLTRFAYEDFWDTTRAGARLSTRSRYDLWVIGPPARLYPASAYEEEPYKILLFRQMLRNFNLEGVLTAEEIPYAYVFFEEARPP